MIFPSNIYANPKSQYPQRDIYTRIEISDNTYMVEEDLKMTYDEMRTAFLLGQITEYEWNEYCTELLYKMMEDNKDIFERLKNA
ncbi:hypothetical protein GWN26_01145 [Candidatus Saccharibacteria bacterium]|nr:hypothetical protein [Candidatus Saccharibacteria bacterium]